MSFQLSPHVDKNKIFLVNLSSCKTRIDPYYYKPEFSALRERLENHPSFQRVGSLIKSWNRGDGPRDGFYTDDVQTGVYFLRVNNLKNHTIDTNDIKYITRYVHENTLKRAQVTAGDVVFAISGTKDNLGTVSVIPRNILEANLNSALVKLELDWSAIDKRYFCYMFDLNTTRVQIDFIGKGAAQNNLNNEEISQIHIFLPSISEQEKIVRYLDEAHFKKKQKEEEAQRSLDSIDDYLLSELGINLQEPEENTIQNRIFYCRLSEVSGSRFDAPAYSKDLSLFSTAFLMQKFKNCVSINPLTLFHKFRGETQATFVPMENISEIYGEADVSQTRNIEESNGYTQFLENDLIWAKITPCMQNGKSSVVSNLMNGIGFGSTEFHVFRAKDDIDIRYIHALLRLKILRRYAILYFSGSAGHQRVSDEFFKKLLIPKPPLAKQLEIVDRITAIRTQAKQLRQAATAELEQAKQEVEAMILG